MTRSLPNVFCNIVNVLEPSSPSISQKQTWKTNITPHYRMSSVIVLVFWNLLHHLYHKNTPEKQTWHGHYRMSSVILLMFWNLLPRLYHKNTPEKQTWHGHYQMSSVILLMFWNLLPRLYHRNRPEKQTLHVINECLL
jgi:uncharacterized membrane protein